jgi:hypothetical protein
MCQCIFGRKALVTLTAIAVLATMVSLFAAFAAGLAWAQQHARQLSTAPTDDQRPKRRRPF